MRGEDVGAGGRKRAEEVEGVGVRDVGARLAGEDLSGRAEEHRRQRKARRAPRKVCAANLTRGALAFGAAGGQPVRMPSALDAAVLRDLRDHPAGLARSRVPLSDADLRDMARRGLVRIARSPEPSAISRVYALG